MLKMARAAHIAGGHVAVDGQPLVDRSNGGAGVLGEVVGFADGKEVIELKQYATASAALKAGLEACHSVRPFDSRRVMRIRIGLTGISIIIVMRVIIEIIFSRRR